MRAAVPDISVSVLGPLPAEKDAITGEELAPMPAMGVVQVRIQGDGHTTVVALSTPNPDNLERWANNLIACAASMRKANAGEPIPDGLRRRVHQVESPPDRAPGDVDDRMPEGRVRRRR